jgi:ATP-binding cassette subfamily F protein 3
MQSIDSLTKAIKNFKGSCIVVTHSEKLLREVCDRLIVFSTSGADYFNGTYDEFLEKIGWEDEEFDDKPKKAPKKIDKKENKKLRAALITEKNKLATPLKKEVEKLENSIMEIEDLIEKKQAELIQASNSGDNSKIIELSSFIVKHEKEVEEKFELLEEKQLKLDEITHEYDKKLEML